MLKNQQTKGYLLAIISTLSVSNVYLFSKAALNQISLGQFLFYWFFLATFWSFLYALKTQQLTTIKSIKKPMLKQFLLIGIVEIAATVLLFYGINTIPNPTIPSFLRNLEPIFITLFGVLILKEKLTVLQKIGATITFLGALLVSYKSSNSLSQFFVHGSEIVIFSTVFYATRTILVKRIINQISPIIVTLNKTIFLFAFGIIALIYSGERIIIPQTAFINILIGSFIGPFFTVLAQNSALQYIEASKVAMIQSTAGFFVVIESFLYFSILPAKNQLLGGLLTMFGFFLMSAAKWKKLLPKLI